MHLRSLLGLTAALLLAACAQQKPPATPAGAAATPAPRAIQSLVYRCAGGDLIAARYQGSNVTIGLPDGLSTTLAATAGGYGDGAITFTERQGSVQVVTPAGSWTDCRPLR